MSFILKTCLEYKLLHFTASTRRILCIWHCSIHEKVYLYKMICPKISAGKEYFLENSTKFFLIQIFKTVLKVIKRSSLGTTTGAFTSSLDPLMNVYLAKFQNKESFLLFSSTHSPPCVFCVLCLAILCLVSVHVKSLQLQMLQRLPLVLTSNHSSYKLKYFKKNLKKIICMLQIFLKKFKKFKSLCIKNLFTEI